MAASRAVTPLLRRHAVVAPRSLSSPFMFLSTSRAIASVSRAQAGASLPAIQSPACRIIQRRTPVPAVARRAYSQASGETPSKIWSFEEVQDLTEDPASNVILVDTREPGELAATGRIPGSINIPISSAPDAFFLPEEEFADRFGMDRPAQADELVFYCKAGVRSRAAARLAKEAGWTNVGEYPGSWMDWVEKGGKVEGK